MTQITKIHSGSTGEWIIFRGYNLKICLQYKSTVNWSRHATSYNLQWR